MVEVATGMIQSLVPSFGGLFYDKVEYIENKQKQGHGTVVVASNVPGCWSVVAAFGPELMLSVAPFCSHVDLRALAATSRPMHVLVKADCVWWQAIVDHFGPELARIGELVLQVESKKKSAPRRDSLSLQPAILVSKLPTGRAEEIYASLRRTTARPFILDQRMRLVLEIHELREWDQHQKEFLLQRRVSLLAKSLRKALRCEDLADALQQQMGATALELISLMALMGNGKVPNLAELPEVRFGPNAQKEIQEILGRRMQKRRQWWQRQREFLLQDLNGSL